MCVQVLSKPGRFAVLAQAALEGWVALRFLVRVCRSAKWAWGVLCSGEDVMDAGSSE